MKRRIHIGVIGNSSGWDTVLNQMGASWETLSSTNLLGVESFSCIVLARKPSEIEKKAVEQFVQKGGTLLDTSGVFFNCKKRVRKVSTLTPHLEPSDFNHIEPFTIRQKCLTLEKTGSLENTAKLPGENDQAIAFLGIPLHLALKSSEPETHLFPCSSGPVVTERAAATRSLPFMQIVQKILTVLHQHAGIPFIHTWWMPSIDKPISTFRIDSDYGTHEALDALNKVLIRHDVPATWFLHVKAHINDLSRFKQRTEDEVAVHGFDHAQFKSTGAAINDIQKAKDTLNDHDFDVKGYAAPYGFWNKPVRKALEKSEFTYSSEFAYDFDSLPSYPHYDAPLQLPVHPISIGTLNKQGYTSSGMETYFREIIKLKLMQRQPIHLYHHPNDRHEEVWTNIFESKEYQHFQQITYINWAEWWIERHHSKNLFFVDDETQLIEQDEKTNAPIAVHWRGDQFALTNQTQISFNDLKFVSFIDPKLNSLIKARFDQSEISFIELQKRKFSSWRWRKRI